MTGYESKKAMAQDKLDSMEREALKLALETFESMNHDDSIFKGEFDGEIAIIKKALAQPAQEPVAWSVIGNGKFGEYKLGQIFVDYEATHIYWKNRGYELVPVYTAPPQRTEQEPVTMRMPKIGDRVVCIEDESLATVQSLTAGGSPDIKFDDGSHVTYLLREFAELFRYASTPQCTWVGLTEKEKKEIYSLSVYVEGAISLTEAKLKEKNNG